MGNKIDIVKHKKRKIISLVIVLAVCLAICISCVILIDNKTVDYERFSVSADNVESETVKGLKIAHLSDLHFPKIKVNIDGLLKKVQEENVDFIAITGDIIDSSAEVNSCGAVDFIKKIVLIAPVYYVNGNHEKGHPQEQLLYDILRSNGVAVLGNESVNVSFGSKRVTIIGLSDNAFYSDSYVRDNPEIKDNYKVLLAHRPDGSKWLSYISAANRFPPHIVLSGHAHGGQFRFFGNGLVAPDQGLFPKYDAGLYRHAGQYKYESEGETHTQTVNMIVSRGIGNSIIPFRFNNKPHVPIITVS